uniref:Secreted protein n=1 Tax=Heterorhabditis bacteriophora TaxID=37862 RepID=A0A1I7XKN2_HETBA
MNKNIGGYMTWWTNNVVLIVINYCLRRDLSSTESVSAAMDDNIRTTTVKHSICSHFVTNIGRAVIPLI